MEEANNIKRKLLETLKELSQQKIIYSKKILRLEEMLDSSKKVNEQLSHEFKEYIAKFPSHSSHEHFNNITPQNTQLNSNEASSTQDTKFTLHKNVNSHQKSLDDIETIITSVFSDGLLNNYSDERANPDESNLEGKLSDTLEYASKYSSLVNKFLKPQILIETLLKEGEWDIPSLVEILNLDEGQVILILDKLHKKQLIKYDLNTKKVWLIR